MNTIMNTRGARLFWQALYILAFFGAIAFAIGLVSFSGASVRTVFDGSGVDLGALYLRLAEGFVSCSAVCFVTRYFTK